MKRQEHDMVRFIHTADVHFGVENYGKVDPHTGIHTRLLDFKRAFDACIEAAVQHQVDFFLFAGDAYKTTTPTPTQQRLLVSSFMKLVRANIPVVMVIGNHDNPLSFGKAHALDIFQYLPSDMFYIIDRPRSFTLATQSGTVQIVGIPWPTRTTLSLRSAYLGTHPQQISSYMSRVVGDMIQQYAAELDPQLPAILTGHLTVSNGIFSGSEKQAIYGKDPVLLPSQLAITPFDYVALGHLHRYQNLNPDGTPVVYSGSIDRIDFGERTEKKGFCLVNIDDKRTSYTFYHTPIRPCIQIDVTISDIQQQTQDIIQALSRYDLKHAIVKIRYYLPENTRDTVDVSAIEHATQAAHYIAGIIPVYTIQTRKRRTHVSTQARIDQLLDTYFRQQTCTSQQRAALTKRAMQLMQEADTED